MSRSLTIKEAIQKIEHYCAYQERCHEEVFQKLRTMRLDSEEINEIIVKLINSNFLNETRFACSFARGKHKIKQWGKVRIVAELKARDITQTNINLALKEIDQEDYHQTFEILSQKKWSSINETKILKRKKYCDYFLRKGYESNLIYDSLKSLENQD